MTVVAVLDVTRLLDESARGKAGAADLKAAWLRKREEYDRALQQAGTLTPENPAAHELQRMDQQAQRELGELRARMIQGVLEAARPVVTALCAERKIDVVLDAQSVFHLHDAALDVTTEIIQRLDGKA